MIYGHYSLFDVRFASETNPVQAQSERGRHEP
jgi:hypothetical protein